MWGRYIAGEYGGMNEVMARLFRLTGDRTFLDTAKLFDNTSFFFGNAAHEGGLGEERGHDPRQARQPAHPADHGRARDVPQHAGDAVLPDRVELLGDRQRQLHVQHRRRGRREDPEQRRVLHRAARLAVGKRLRQRRPERDLRHVQPAEAGSPAVHVRPDREVHGPLRARALQPHPRLGRRGRTPATRITCR